MTSEVPGHPTEPFDGSHLSDQQVLRLTNQQRYHAVLTERQLKMEQDARPPVETRPDYIPSAENLAKIEALVSLIDLLHERAHGPTGVAWVELKMALLSFSQTIEWIETNPPINNRYRYRIDSPMNPDAEVPDHLPKEWT